MSISSARTNQSPTEDGCEPSPARGLVTGFLPSSVVLWLKKPIIRDESMTECAVGRKRSNRCSAGIIRAFVKLFEKKDFHAETRKLD